MGSAVGVDAEALRSENERLKAEVAALREQVAQLQATITGGAAAGNK
jgi:cell division protein FtsB